MEKPKILLEDLIREPAMIEHCKTWPSTEGHKNLLLYEDSDDDFVVYAVVRMPAAPAGFTITPTHRPFMDLSTASRDWNDPGASTPLKGRTMRLFDSKASAKASPGKVDLVQPFATSLEIRRSGQVGGRNCPL
jgi:hypothetical protein